MTSKFASPKPAQQPTQKVADPPSSRSETGQLDDGEVAVPVNVNDILEPGELLILAIKPSPWFILIESLPSLAMLTLFVIVAVALATHGYFGLAGYQRDLVFAGVGLGGMRLFYQLLDWLARTYVLTDRRVVTMSGLITPTVTETELKDILSADLCATFRERLAGLGTILFRANDNVNLMHSAWRSLARPNDVHEIVNQTIKRYR